MKPMPFRVAIRLRVRVNVLLWLSFAVLACLTATPAKAPAQSTAGQPPEGPTKLLRFADISKDRVVFAYAGDLWIAARDGGAARRLTSHIGDELFPKFSPDGKWIAFTGEYDGNPDVYVISAEGGEPKRLTFHPSNDIDRKSTRLNSSHLVISYAVFCLKKKKLTDPWMTKMHVAGSSR